MPSVVSCDQKRRRFSYPQRSGIDARFLKEAENKSEEFADASKPRYVNVGKLSKIFNLD